VERDVKTSYQTRLVNQSWIFFRNLVFPKNEGSWELGGLLSAVGDIPSCAGDCGTAFLKVLAGSGDGVT